MLTLKKGSKGEDVKTLLKYLGLTQDGVFGPKTEEALKKFQSQNKLVSDGICGPKTWEVLMNSKTDSKCIDSSVVYLPLNTHITKLQNRGIKYLVIHFTAGSKSSSGTARSIKRVFESRSASADFAVDDAEMVLFNPNLNNYYCWAVSGGHGITNANSISIEICSNLKTGTSVSAPNHEGWYFTEASINNAVKLAKIIMKKYNIPLDRVVRHYDVTGKLCPGLVGWNDGKLYTVAGKLTNNRNNSLKWNVFKERLK